MKLGDLCEVSFITVAVHLIFAGVTSAKNSLFLSPLTIYSDGALLQWCGLPLDRVRDCTVWYSFKTNSSWMSTSYLPSSLSKNYTFELEKLKPLTDYDAYGVCNDNDKNMYKSEAINFTTAADSGNSVDYPETPSMRACKATKYPEASSSPGIGPVMSTTSIRLPGADGSMVPTVLKERMPSKASKVDIGLGVAFGLLGAGIVCAGAYWVLKEYRRRMRIRRFLQYRQHENETFPDMDIDNDEDEGIVL